MQRRTTSVAVLVSLAFMTLVAACARAPVNQASSPTPETRPVASPVASPPLPTPLNTPTTQAVPAVAVNAAEVPLATAKPSATAPAQTSRPASIATGSVASNSETITVTINSSAQATSGSTARTVATVAPSPATPTTAAPARATTRPPAEATQPPPAALSGASQAGFLLCGGMDTATGQAIAHFIGGRGFRAQLTGGPDGCANLTITLTGPSSGTVTGTQSTHLSVSTGKRQVAVDIVTENGVTRASVG